MSEDAFDWDIGLAMFSDYDADGFLGVTVGRFGGQKQGSPSMEVHHTFGFVSRPMDPDVDASGQPVNGCAVLFATEGDQTHAWLAADPRYVAPLPQVQKGESFMYGSAGQFIRCHADGSVSVYTTDDGTPRGRAIYFRVSPTDGFMWVCPWGQMSFGPNGFHVRNAKGDARIDLGSIGGMPPPLDQLSSYVKIEGAMVSIKSPAVSLGTDGGAANVAASELLSSFLTALVAAIGTITTASPGATAIGTLTPLMPPLLTALQGLGKTV